MIGSRRAQPLTGGFTAAAVLLVAGLVAEPPAALGAQPPVVRSIQLEMDFDAGDDDLHSLLSVTEGDPLSVSALRRSVTNLYTSGRISSVAVHSREDAPGTIDLRFRIVGAAVVSQVDLDGELGVSRERIRGVMEARRGQVLSSGRVIRSVFAIRDLLTDTGFFDARVRPEVETDEQKKESRVVFQIAAGSRAIVADVVVHGVASDLTTALEQELQLGVGVPFSRNQLVRDRERLRLALRELGYLEASVEEPSFSRTDPRGLVIEHGVRLGRRIEVAVEGTEGMGSVSDDLLEDLGKVPVDEAQIRELEARLLERLHRRGFVDAELARGQESDEENVEVVLSVTPKERWTLRRIEFDGNRSLAATDLEARMTTSKKKRWLVRPARLVRSELEADLERLRSYYALEGFAQAVVGPAVLERGSNWELGVVIPVVEGERSVIGAIDLDMPLVDAATTPVAIGDPYHVGVADQLRQWAVALYSGAGFRRPLVEVTVEGQKQPGAIVSLGLRVEPGLRTVVDRVLLRGLARTRRELVLDHLELRSGMPLPRAAVREAERRLYALGVFRRVVVDLGASRETDWAEGVERRDVVVRLEEGQPYRLAYGLGYDTEDGVGASLIAARTNLFGGASSLQLDLRVSEREERYRLLYVAPNTRRGSLPIQFAAFHLDETFGSFRSERRGGQLEVRKPVGRATFSLFADYRLVELDLTEAGAAVLPVRDRDRDSVRIASITPSVMIDRRDDRLSPTRGHSLLAQLELAEPVLATDVRFEKFFAQATRYVDLRRFGVLATSVRLGAIRAPGPEDEPERDRIPLSERFFAGGRTTHRAYERDRLGVHGSTIIDDVEVGGGSLLLANVELRFPIWGAVGGTVFGDAGNVWADRSELALDELKVGLGFGFRYRSPIGPLRIDVGWKLDRELGESPAVVFVSFGNPF